MAKATDHMVVTYRIEAEDGSREEFALDISLPAVELAPPPAKGLPDWTRLDYHQCEHCPLKPRQSPYCPVAAQLVDYGQRMGRAVSYKKVKLTVDQEGKHLTAEVPAHEALRSVLGLVMATSGCPHMKFFKALARYHQPLADMELTILRSMSFYLLHQYFRGTKPLDWDTSFAGLIEIYKAAQEVNRGLANRLRQAQVFKELNWLAELDTFAAMMPLTVERSLLKAKTYFTD